ncbi:Uncharacterized protein FWK35_00017136, partial [Aphis craccivora]
MENLVFYKHKKFYDFPTSKLFANFRVFDRFQQLIRNLVMIFPGAFENYWKFFTFDSPKNQLDLLSYQKQGPLFKIEALLLLQNVVTDTKIKKTHIIFTYNCLSSMAIDRTQFSCNINLKRITDCIQNRGGHINNIFVYNN